MWNDDEPELRMKISELEDKIVSLEVIVGEMRERVRQFDSVMSSAFDLHMAGNLKRKDFK